MHILEKSAFEQALFEYREEQKTLAGQFVAGICKLGAILQKHKENLIAEKRWVRFCEEIGISVCSANAQIRFYEFAIQNKYAELLGTTIDNWGKMLSFLSLTDGQRNILLENTQLKGTVDLSTGEFKEMVDEIKNESNDLVITNELHCSDEEITKKIHNEKPTITGLKNNTIDYSQMPTEFLTDALQKEMNLPKEFKPIIEGMVDIEKGIAKVKIPDLASNMERQLIKAMLIASKTRIENLLAEL